MRIRLRVLLPLLVGVLLGTAFFAAAITVGDAVGSALGTVPGITRDRAVEVAVRAVVVAGIIATLLAVALSFLIASLLASPLARMARTAGELAEGDAAVEPATPVAEIWDAARGVTRATGELRARHGAAVQERSQLAALVEAVSEGIMQVDSEGRIVRSNRAAVRLLGLPDRVVGYMVPSLLRNVELRELVEAGLAGRATEGAEVVVEERRLLVSLLPQPEGGVVATFVDLTDLRRLEEVRRDFVANASHELKTPLTSIRGYSETLLSGDLPDAERRQFLETIARNTERLQRIVDDLLDLSRLEAGRWHPHTEPVRVMGVARGAWSGFADRADDADVEFSATEAEGDELTVLADRRGLEQVFANLYDNALRHTPEGGTIRVTARSTDAPPAKGRRGGRGSEPGGSDRRWVVVEVADTGAGVPRDALPRIFERFYRVDPARSRAEGGTGLGLSIVKHMMESMGGGVRAESDLGKGTTIQLWLPASGPTA